MEIIYNKSSLYHELQHSVDIDTKYKDKYYNLNKNYNKVEEFKGDEVKYIVQMSEYLSQPIEYNAWFTSIIMPSLEKNSGIGFKNFIKKLHTENESFKVFFEYTGKSIQQKFLKRAYKYHQQYNKQPKNK